MDKQFKPPVNVNVVCRKCGVSFVSGEPDADANIVKCPFGHVTAVEATDDEGK